MGAVEAAVTERWGNGPAPSSTNFENRIQCSATADGVIPRRVVLRQCKYLNNVIEQDHRTIKKRVLRMIRKGRVRWLAKGNAVGQADFIAGLFGLAA
jgi:transposase, IS6 family